MPRSVQKDAAAARIRAGRRLEGEDRYARYHRALHDYPSSGEFGVPDFVDDEGRRYRIAYTTRRPWAPGERIPPRPHDAAPITHPQNQSQVKLWVMLPKARARFGANAPRPTDPGRWFDGQRLGAGGCYQAMRGVRATAPFVIQVHSAHRADPRHRTGYVYASGVKI